jgi:gamma-glutamyl phosphate reductase
MATTAQSVAEICAAARGAARGLARLDTESKNAALLALADALERRTDEILEANRRDMEAGEEAGLDAGLLDRLELSEKRLAGIAADVRAIAGLPDPVGETIEGWRLPNGLDIRRVRVPIGVVAVVYEARPNVTVDCSALCLKSGNAIVLRGSSTAAHSNAVLAQVASSAVSDAGVPAGAISIVSGGERDELRQIATQADWETEYHALILAVKVVDTVEEAIEHINRYGSGHSEAIVTRSTEAAREFTEGVDAACVYVNASTRFTDGAVFGMGAEIGNSTQKLHARGPIALRELTTYKFVIEGSGQVRE